MADEKDILLKLCHELSQKKVDLTKVNELLEKTDIPQTNNPMELTNHILKRLHPYQENS
jgi:hypothetical protein